ncbi:hypothetical protein PI126_g14459 [Phytophthora idaei]|nr:hypothetical protein PI126_g14459 [Phytophthora idaei]
MKVCVTGAASHLKEYEQEEDLNADSFARIMSGLRCSNPLLYSDSTRNLYEVRVGADGCGSTSMNLQSEQNNKLCRQSPLAELEVADVTWDFEGTVADTLSMEIQELEDRAAMSETDTCIVLSASSQAAAGQAVIWFPLDRNDDVDDRKKRQTLLYVCPGRVKVVKSVSDLIKKMYNELPTLREDGATYNVWAVVMGSKSLNQQEEERTSIQLGVTHGEKNQHMADSVLKPSNSPGNSTQVRSRVDDPSQIHPSVRSPESRRSRDSNNNQDVIGNQSGSVVDDDDATRDEEPDKDKLLPVSPQFSVYRDVSSTKPYLTKSIFSFGVPQKSSTELTSSEQVMDSSDDTARNTQDEIALKTCAGNLEGEATAATIFGEEMDSHKTVGGDEVDLHDNNQLQSSRSRRTVVSSSLADFTVIKKECIEEETGLGLGVRLQQGFAWQSCDGKVLRKTVLAQQPTKDTGVEPKENEGLTSSVSRKSRGDDKEAVVEEQREVDAGNEEVHDKAHDGVRDGDDTKLEHDAGGVIRSDEVQTSQHENNPQTLIKVTKTEDNNPGSSSHVRNESSTFTNQAGDNTQVSVDSPRPLDKAANASSSVEVPGSVDNENPSDENGDDAVGRSLEGNVPNSDEKGGSFVRMAAVDFPEHSESTIRSEKELPMQNPKPVVNYRDKLGARIWWELEYTAKRLEREEMIERQQQARQRQGTVQQGKRVTGRHSRQMKPTGWSTNNRSAKQREEETVSNKNGCNDQQSSGKLNTTEALQISNKQAHSDQSPRSFGNEIPPCKSASPTRSQERLESFKPTEVFEQMESSPISSKGEGDNTTRVSAVQERHKHGEVPVVCSTPDISPAGSLSTLSTSRERDSQKSYDQRQPSSISFSKPAERESVKPSFVRATVKPASTKSNNQAEDEDEALTQMMWGSTRTSYEQERNAGIFATTKEDELLTSEVAFAVPFTHRGRVPMRSRRSTIIPATDESSSPSSTEHSPSSCGSLRPSKHHASRDLQSKLAVTTPAPVATYIALEEENNATISAKSREERLKELRQKKLQKLQQARDSSLQQQKDRQQRQMHRPLSFSNSIYTKRASNRQLVQNALEFTLLAGGSMEKERMLALQALAESTCDNFIVLLKSARELKFRALYENHVDRDFATRIFSLLPSNSSRAPPKLESSEKISQFFKYSSAKKQFLPVPTRSFTVKTDACALVDQLVFKGKSGSALARLL